MALLLDRAGVRTTLLCRTEEQAKLVADARVNAGSDVDGRMVVLDGYAEYLRSLQTIVTDIR